VRGDSAEVLAAVTSPTVTPRTIPIATLFPGYFELVMATGILAVAAKQQDLGWLANALYLVAAIAYVVLVVLVLARLVFFPRLFYADLTRHS
jgi:uncharacterized membrane protein YvlD (DUF360 family)